MKTGFKTTAFWVTLCTNVIAFVTAMQGQISPVVAVIIIAAANFAYGLLRTWQKVSTENTGKPGWQSTEFIMAVFTNLAGLLTVLHGQFANVQAITVILGTVNTAYGALRTWLGIVHDSATSDTPAVAIDATQTQSQSTASAIAQTQTQTINK